MNTNDMNETAQPEETVVLQIILTKNGAVKIQGPMLVDRTACYGLLETAKDMVREMHAPKIVKPFGGLMKMNGRH